MARAALFAGLAFSNTKTALAHSVSYPITLKYGIPHGLACSFSLPMVMASVLGADEDCDHSLQRIFGDDLDAGVDRLENFLVNLGVSTAPGDDGLEGEAACCTGAIDASDGVTTECEVILAGLSEPGRSDAAHVRADELNLCLAPVIACEDSPGAADPSIWRSF